MSKSRPSAPGISIRNGPVADDAMDLDHPTNGIPKRKARSSVGTVNYAANLDDSDDGAPLVRHFVFMASGMNPNII